MSKTTTNKQNTLPQTGENKSNLGIIGLGLLHWLVYLD
ncbi:LPXTG cell wall anchor domain-containing protein [Lactobacillus amylovorus]